MLVRIHRVKSSKQRAMLREAAKLFLRELVPQHVYQHLSVSIYINPWCKNLGWCAPLRHRKDVRPRKFMIELHHHSWKTRSIIKTLGHETVHVKQYAMGELVEPLNDEAITLWKGRKINDEELAYHKHPWEIEAAGNEENLWELWKQRKSLDVP